jgi:hypothetical protein
VWGDLLAATDGVVRHRTIDGCVLFFLGTVDLREAVRHPRERAQFDESFTVSDDVLDRVATFCFFEVALKRLHVLSSNSAALPINISMDWRLWALMGISATSLVGSPLILSSKTNQEPQPKTVDKAAAALNEPVVDIQRNSQGTLYSNPRIADASLIDMFQGDEIGNTAYVDVSKVQMFYFTIVAVLAYAYALYSAMNDIYPARGFAMPTPSDALVALLGISHAAYLTSKTTQHS